MGAGCRDAAPVNQSGGPAIAQILGSFEGRGSNLRDPDQREIRILRMPVIVQLFWLPIPHFRGDQSCSGIEVLGGPPSILHPVAHKEIAAGLGWKFWKTEPCLRPDSSIQRLGWAATW
jgi:hypothetical protein